MKKGFIAFLVLLDLVGIAGTGYFYKQYRDMTRTASELIVQTVDREFQAQYYKKTEEILQDLEMMLRNVDFHEKDPQLRESARSFLAQNRIALGDSYLNSLQGEQEATLKQETERIMDAADQFLDEMENGPLTMDRFKEALAYSQAARDTGFMARNAFWELSE